MMGHCCTTAVDEEKDRLVEKDLDVDRKNDKQVKKLLLLGAGSSGKTTFFKQLKRIHGEGFTNKDRLDYRAQIYNQCIEQMQKLIARSHELTEDRTNESLHLGIKTSQAIQAAQFIEYLRRDAEVNEEVGNNINILWKDEGIKNTFELRARLAIPDSCEHFFSSIKRISAKDYVPTDEDILLVRKRTTGIIEEYFTIKGTKFHIFDVGGQRNERKKWIHCFEHVTAVIFVASLSSYDEVLLEDETVIVMHETLNLFDEICNSRYFINTSIILFLNKKDLFESKLQHTPLTACFQDYEGPSLYEPALQFTITKFQERDRRPKDKNIYIHITCATDKPNVERVFNDVQHIVINISLHRGGLI